MGGGLCVCAQKHARVRSFLGIRFQCTFSNVDVGGLNSFKGQLACLERNVWDLIPYLRLLKQHMCGVGLEVCNCVHGR